MPAVHKHGCQSEGFCLSKTHRLCRAQVCTAGSTSTGAGRIGESSGTSPPQLAKVALIICDFLRARKESDKLEPMFDNFGEKRIRRQALDGDDLGGGGRVCRLHAG